MDAAAAVFAQWCVYNNKQNVRVCNIAFGYFAYYAIYVHIKTDTHTQCHIFLFTYSNRMYSKFQYEFNLIIIIIVFAFHIYFVSLTFVIISLYVRKQIFAHKWQSQCWVIQSVCYTSKSDRMNIKGDRVLYFLWAIYACKIWFYCYIFMYTPCHIAMCKRWTCAWSKYTSTSSYHKLSLLRVWFHLSFLC